MPIEGTEAGTQHGCGALTEPGKEVWRQGSGIDGGGMVLVFTRRKSR